MAAAAVKLRPVEVSPSTLQYRMPIQKAYPIYKKRFHPNEDAKKTLSQPWLQQTDPMMPPYPFGKNVFFEEANQGLYGGATIQSGNKIAKGRNKGKTLRKWYPNVRVEQLKSESLDVMMSLPTTARVMRTIRKLGGLDEYLMGTKPARIKELGLLGWKLRWLVMNSQAMKEKHGLERRTLGLSETTAIDTKFEEAWADPTIRADIMQKMHTGWEALGKKDEKFKKHIQDQKRKWQDVPEEIPELHALRIYDPKKLELPETVEVEGSRYKIKVKRIPDGRGTQELEKRQLPQKKQAVRKQGLTANTGGAKIARTQRGTVNSIKKAAAKKVKTMKK